MATRQEDIQKIKVMHEALTRQQELLEKIKQQEESIEEQYISDDYKYLVGHISLANLHKIAAQIRERDLFIAAYPTK